MSLRHRSTRAIPKPYFYHVVLCLCAALTGLSPGALAAAIAVPIAVVLAALLLACCCIRRRNLRRMEAAQMQSLQDSKDLEAGSLQALPPDDAAVGRIRDQKDLGMQVRGELVQRGSGRTSGICTAEPVQHC